MSDTIIDSNNSTAAVDSPSETTPVSTSETPVTIDPVTPSETPPIDNPENATSNSTDVIDGMQEAELLSIIDSIMNPKTDPATEPTSFPTTTPVETPSATDDVNAEIARLTKEVENSVEKEAQLEALKAERQAEKDNATLIENTWAALAEAVPLLSELLPNFVKSNEDGTVSYDNESIPLHFRSENWKRVEEDPIIWPLVKARLSGEQVDIPGFVKAFISERQKSLPITSGGEKPVTNIVEPPIQNGASILNRNKKTISLT